MITINQIQYRNLEEQVLQNTELLNLLPTGISSPNFKGIFSTQKEVDSNVEVGDIYLFGTDAPFELFYYDKQLGIVSLGVFPRPGSKGEPGSQGPEGKKGETGAGWTTGTTEPTESAADGTLYFDSNSNDIYEFRTGRWVRIGNVQGKPGIRGPQGKTGPRGLMGPPGVMGPAGPSGASYVIRGTVRNVSALSTIPPSTGLAYLVGTENNYTLYLAINNAWEPIGPIASQIPRPLQELGNSLQDTMSQRAITNEFKYLSSNIYSNISQLYEYIPYTPVAVLEQTYYKEEDNRVTQVAAGLDFFRGYLIVGSLGKGFKIKGQHYYDAPLWMITDFDGNITRMDTASNEEITNLESTIIFQEGEVNLYVNYNGGTTIEESTLDLTSLKLGEEATEAFPGDKGKYAYDSTLGLGGQSLNYIRIANANEANEFQEKALVATATNYLQLNSGSYYGYFLEVKQGERYRVIGTNFSDSLCYCYVDLENKIVKKPTEIGIIDEDITITESGYLYVLSNNYSLFKLIRSAASATQPLNYRQITFLGDVSPETIALFNSYTGARGKAGPNTYAGAPLTELAQEIVNNNLYLSGKLGDYTVIFGGLAEWNNSIPLGSYNTTDYNPTVDPTTYYGALETIVRNILSLNKKCMTYAPPRPYQWYDKRNTINIAYTTYQTGTNNMSSKYGCNNVSTAAFNNLQLFPNQLVNYKADQIYLNETGIREIVLPTLVEKLTMVFHPSLPPVEILT